MVALISLVTKVSSLEVARQISGDLDCEFRAHGIGSLAAAPLGRLISSLQTGTSRLLEQAGGATRLSGVVSAVTLGAVALASFDLPGLIPIAIVAGLVLNLGYTLIVDALWRPCVQRAWLDLLLALAIMIVCVRYGYRTGVLAGLLCPCVMFAISYAQIGVVRRHLTRAQFAGHVDRAPDAAAYLRDNGEAIQIYWLSGYIFLDFRRACSSVSVQTSRRCRWPGSHSLFSTSAWPPAPTLLRCQPRQIAQLLRPAGNYPPLLLSLRRRIITL